ncbi:MAG: hypothetical protein ABSC94_27635 [Polyangiaceae bacterium]
MCTEFVPECALSVTTVTVLAATELSTVQFESSVVLPSNPSQKMAVAGQFAEPPSPEPLPESAEVVFPPASLDPPPALVVATELTELDVLTLLVLPVAGVLVLGLVLVLVLVELVVAVLPRDSLELLEELCRPVEFGGGCVVLLLPHAATAQHAKPSASLRSGIVVVRMVVGSPRVMVKCSFNTPAPRPAQAKRGPGESAASSEGNPPRRRRTAWPGQAPRLSVNTAKALQRGLGIARLQSHSTLARHAAGIAMPMSRVEHGPRAATGHIARRQRAGNANAHAVSKARGRDGVTANASARYGRPRSAAC